MIRGVTYDREDTCPKCRKQRSLEIYDKNNNPGRLSLILDMNQFYRLQQRQFYYIKCTSCGEEFRIDWSNPNRIPVPLLGNKLKYFLEDYVNSYEDNS